MKGGFKHIFRVAVITLLALSVSGCSNQPDHPPGERLEEAIRNRDFSEVVSLLEEHHPKLVSGGDHYRYYSTAIEQVGSFDIVVILEAYGLDVNSQDSETLQTPLHCAANSLWISKFLISQGADPSFVDGEENLPIHEAARMGHKSNVDLYLSKGVPVSERNSKGDTLLHSTFRVPCSSPDIIATARLLLQQGLTANLKNVHGQTPLHLAAANCYKVEPIEFLLKSGAKKSLKDHNGNTPADLAKKRPQPAFSHLVQVLEE